MSEALASLGVGAALGAAFCFTGLPIPAPPTVAGIVGVVGVWLGYTMAQSLH